MAPPYVFPPRDLREVVPPPSEIHRGPSLAFLRGATIRVMGPSGAGRSGRLRIMAGVDSGTPGEARPAEGIGMGSLPQEPRLEPTRDARGNVEDGAAPVRDLLRRFEAVRARLAERLLDAEVAWLPEERAPARDAIGAIRGGELGRAREIRMAASVDPTREALHGTVREAISDGEETLPCGRRTLSSRGDGASFGFRGADRQKRVRGLSGGERRRTPVARRPRRGAGLLLPDQPRGRRL